MKRRFWLLLGALLLQPGYSQAVDMVKVDKLKRLMWLLDDGQVVREYRIALGAEPKGHKRQEGDERTPEGVYQLDYKKDDSYYHRAMHINYPNDQDLADAVERGVSPGGLIMIHGQRPGADALAQYFDWTDGCIAITNEEMDEFLTLVNEGTTIEIRWTFGPEGPALLADNHPLDEPAAGQSSELMAN